MRIRFFKYSLSLVLLSLFLATNTLAQEQDLSNYRMRFRFKSIKQPDQSRILEASFIAANRKDRKDRVPVYGADINFLNVLGGEQVSLGASKTSKEGIARVTLSKDQSYLMDDEGRITLRAVFEGTDELDMEEEEISIRDVRMTVDLIEKDSVRTISVMAHTLDSLGVEVPVEEAEVIISVEGMLSKMIIDEGTIEGGAYEMKMPTGLPGNAKGNITVYAIIEDHDDYGDVVQRETESWGIINKRSNTDENTLWSEAAPIWMYVVLTILLVGIWANFVYTGIHLLKIKKEGKQIEAKTEN